MAKSIHDVIDELLEQVPLDYEHREALEKRFNWIKQDASYRPPELMYISWGYVTDALVKYIGNTDEVFNVSWKASMSKIFTRLG